jgi:hypothetical protein
MTFAAIAGDGRPGPSASSHQLRWFPGFRSGSRRQCCCQRFRADDEEYSVIPKSFLPALSCACCDATLFACAYFDGALAEAPASTRPDVSSAAQKKMAIVAATAARHLYIASSTCSETTQQTRIERFLLEYFRPKPCRPLVVSARDDHTNLGYSQEKTSTAQNIITKA